MNKNALLCDEAAAQVLLRQYLQLEDLPLLHQLAFQGFKAAQITLRLWSQP